MNEESAAFLRAVRGPVIMITIGALFALDAFTPFSFGRTWPILLVVIGILNLGRRSRWDRRLKYQAQWGPPRSPQPPFPPFPFGGPGACGNRPSPAASSAGASRPAGNQAPGGASGGASTAPPGTYRGSTYQTTGQDASNPASGSAARQNRPRTPDTGSPA
jgi:hypothetical protein